ncbi:MAG TPA: sugar phosphate isomerase/epimerase family protein [Streptosporangiaceae bacterium]|jgi:sugar phosphate isomerase/epimerase
MRLIPSVLNWSYHRDYWGAWDKSLESYVPRVSAVARKHGFEQSGINLGVGGEQNQLASFDDTYVKDVRHRLDDLGLQVIPILGNLDIHADPTFVRRSVEAFKPALERSAVLGATVSTFGTSLHGRLTREKAVTIYAEAAAEICEVAAGFGQSLCAENYNTFTSDELMAVVERSGASNHGYLNDIGNWLITGEDPYSVTRKLLPRTIHLHIKDYALDDGVWRSVPLGDGIVPVRRILQTLADAEGDATLYLAIETDLDGDGEDEAMDRSYAYYADWAGQMSEGVAR